MSDRSILRDLASKVRVIADLPEMELRRARWKRHNSLQGERPMVLCFPEGSWGEINATIPLQCVDPENQGIERNLRSQLYWWEHINDDSTLEPFYNINWNLQVGNFGFDVPMTHGDNRGSYVWQPPMTDLSRDLEKLHFRSLSVDRDSTTRYSARINELIGDLLPVRIRGMLWWTVGMTWEAAKLIGLENLMWAMVDQPDELHRLMAFLRDDTMNFITWCEREKLLTPNDGPADYVGSGGVGMVEGLRTDPAVNRPVKLSEMWGFSESQETVGISPQMFEEFILPYQVPLAEKFGLNYYGCCEGLEHRIDSIMKQIPRLRKVSVAPNANQAVMAEKLSGNHIYCRKPYPAHVCLGFNETAIRADLRDTLALAGNHPLEIILKDTHTVENDISRFERWVRIAREEIATHLEGRGSK